EVLKALIAGGADINRRDSSGETAADYAKRRVSQSPELYRLLTGKEHSNRNLFVACSRGNLTQATEIVGSGVSPNICDDSGLTPLICAACEGHFGIVRMLCNAGADPWVNSSRAPNLSTLRTSLADLLDELRKRLNKFPVTTVDAFKTGVEIRNGGSCNVGTGNDEDL